MHKNVFKEENRSGKNVENGGVYCTIRGNDAHECRQYAAVGLGYWDGICGWDTDNTKCEGIVKLINDVKSAEGTRLDAFGMQAHYNVDGFSAAQFKSVAKKYAQAAGKLQ